MLKKITVSVLQQQTPMLRYYATNKVKIREKISLLKQDTDKFPTYEYNRSKRTDRRVYAWGFAATGALGMHQALKQIKRKNTEIIHHPSRQSFAERRNVIDCAAGYGFTLFACKREDDDITLFGTGLNTDSQIGFHKLGGVTNRPMEAMVYPAPISLPKISEEEVIDIKKCAAGRAHSMALSENGILFTMGNNAFGQCARRIVDDEQYKASQMVHRIDVKTICDGDTIKEIVCGQDHSLLLTDGGRVYSCGWGADGQTGLGHFNSTDAWTRVAGDILNEKIVKIVSKVDCVLALNDKGEVFGWGNSEYEQLNKDMQQVNTPIQLKATQICGKIKDIAVGGSSCIVLNENGEVFVWGYGLLGLGPSAENVRTPTIIPSTLFGRNEFNPESHVSAVYSGISHMGAVTNTCDLYMWGRNRTGCLGLGHEKDQFFPFKLAIGAMVETIDCGVDHTIAYCKPFM